MSSIQLVDVAFIMVMMIFVLVMLEIFIDNFAIKVLVASTTLASGLFVLYWLVNGA